MTKLKIPPPFSVAKGEGIFSFCYRGNDEGVFEVTCKKYLYF